MGKYLIKSLLSSGEYVWVLIRPLEKNGVFKRAGELFGEYLNNYPDHLKIVSGDILKKNLGMSLPVRTELKGKQVFLWHLAANLSFASKNEENVKYTNIVGTQNAVNLANSLAARYLHVSTVYVCGDSRETFTEDDLDVGQKFRNGYESSKFEAEKFVRKNCKIPYIVFRPSIIMGDAYEGKAEGCTFGYYRFIFMFYVLKNIFIKTIKKKNFSSGILKMLGTRYDSKSNSLRVPWMIIPFPAKGVVDMVSVDYVVDSMLEVNSKLSLKDSLTVHLVQKNKPEYKFLLQALLDDLGFRGVKLMKVPNVIFKAIFKFIYCSVGSIRTYMKSISWYIPYFTHEYRFGLGKVRKIKLKCPPMISREFMRKINTYASKEILEKIDIKKFL